MRPLPRRSCQTLGDFMHSYSVRCILLWCRRPEQKLAHLYEERTTLWNAEGIDQALELAEAEAEAYATPLCQYDLRHLPLRDQ